MIKTSLVVRCLQQALGSMLCIGLLVWLATLLVTASDVQTLPNGDYPVTLGPLLFHTINKAQNESGSTVSFSMETGLIAYIGLCAIVGVGIGLLLWLWRRKAVRPYHEGR